MVFLVISLVFAQEFEIEEREEIEEEPEESEEYFEEELIEEEILIEDKAGTTPDSPFYFVDEVVEDINLAIRDGEDKADYALDLSEEKIAEAKLMADKNKSIETEEALIRANNISKIIEQEVSPDLENETNEKMEFVRNVLEDMEGQVPKDWESIKDLIDRQKTQAEKNKIAANLAVKIGDLCGRLSLQDYSLMEAEPRCNPENAPDWLKDLIEDEIQKREEEALKMMQEILTSCVMDPRTCDCSKIPIKRHQLDCEKGTSLAIKCEFEEDFEACNELDAIGPPKFENLPPFIRDALTTTFEELVEKKEKEMFDKFAPPECNEAGAFDRESCEAVMEEKYGPTPGECMKNGRFIGPRECEELMMKKNPPPEECIEDGRFIGRDECEQMMMEKYNIPEECKGEDGHLLPEEECRAIMEEKGLIGGEGEAPPECVKDGEFIGREECEAIMREKGTREGSMPSECEGLTREECEELIKERGGREIRPIPDEEIPVECEGLSREECAKIMESKPELPIDISKLDELENVKKYEFGNPNKVTVIGENGAESIPKEDIEKIKEEALKKSQERIRIPEEAEELNNEIEELEEIKESESFEEIREKIEVVEQEGMEEEVREVEG